MKSLALAILLAATSQEADRRGKEKLDAPVEDFKLIDLLQPGESWTTLSAFREKKAVVLVFTSYSCDACTVYEERLRRLLREFAGKDVVFLALRSSAEDTAEGMRAYAAKAKLGIPILDDVENRIADRYGAAVTPTFRVIDRAGVLRFRGALDDALVEEQAKTPHLKRAIEAVLEGRDVPVKDVKAVGCLMPRVQDRR